MIELNSIDIITVIKGIKQWKYFNNWWKFVKIGINCWRNGTVWFLCSRPSAIHSIHFILLFENEKNDWIDECCGHWLPKRMYWMKKKWNFFGMKTFSRREGSSIVFFFFSLIWFMNQMKKKRRENNWRRMDWLGCLSLWGVMGGLPANAPQRRRRQQHQPIFFCFFKERKTSSAVDWNGMKATNEINGMTLEWN